MTLLDNRTLNLVQIAVSLVLFLIMFIAWRTQKIYPGFSRWTMSKLCHAIGFTLIGLHGSIPDWLSIVVANLLLFTSVLLIMEGTRQFLQKAHRDVVN